MDHQAGVLLVNPKFPHNVGAAIRGCSIFGADILTWAGKRVNAPSSEAGGRIPREERMKEYAKVEWVQLLQLSKAVDDTISMMGAYQDFGAAVPVCVELTDNAERLQDFQHPRNALYVFGPEDGSVIKGIRTACHRFVMVPSRSCMNLGAAVNVVLNSRCEMWGFPE